MFLSGADESHLRLQDEFLLSLALRLQWCQVSAGISSLPRARNTESSSRKMRALNQSRLKHFPIAQNEAIYQEERELC